MFDDFYLSKSEVSEIESMGELSAVEVLIAGINGRSGMFYHKKSCEPTRMIYFPANNQVGREFYETFVEIARKAAMAAEDVCDPHKALPVSYYKEFLDVLEACSKKGKDFRVGFYRYVELLNDLKNAGFLSLSEARDWFQRIPSYIDCHRNGYSVAEFGGPISLDKVDSLRQRYPYSIMTSDRWPKYADLFVENGKESKCNP